MARTAAAEHVQAVRMDAIRWGWMPEPKKRKRRTPKEPVSNGPTRPRLARSRS
jgi:hypothetical protein